MSIEVENVSTMYDIASDDYLQTFCVTAYAAKTTNKE
jgi:hypothetical protein